MPSSARPASQTGYPLYYDAVNEKGLGMAGLNFVGNAAYAAPLCGQAATWRSLNSSRGCWAGCAGLAEARAALAELNLVGTPFSAHFPAAQLHGSWRTGRARSWSSPWRTGCTSTTARRAS